MSASSSKWLRYAGAFALALTLTSLSAGTVWAQNQPHLQVPQTPQPPHFSPHDLKSFARAAIDVQRVARKYRTSWQAAKTPHDKLAVAQKAQQQEIQAVKANGITVRKYRAIAIAARTDAQTRAKIMAYIQQYSTPGSD